jgi:hypothetical protein
MNPTHRLALCQEFALARTHMTRGSHATALAHLERAHVLGQADVRSHALSHWLMLRLELARRQPVAALGQAVRLVLAVFATTIGLYPVGNTGGSNVNMFKRMPIDAGLQEVMRGGGEGRP